MRDLWSFVRPLLIFLAALVALETYRDARARPRPAPAAPEPDAPASPAPRLRSKTSRDPFVTGPDWRAQQRLTASPPAPPPSATTPAPSPILPRVVGTFLRAGRRYAITESSIVGPGGYVEGFAVRSVSADRVVLEHHGHSFDLPVLAPATVLPAYR